jgi:hypothetical protein
MRAPIESRLLLAAASRLVPRELRADWRREWEAEVWWWLEGQPDSRSLAARLRLAAHCRGAFADARCLRRESSGETGGEAGWLRSPGGVLAAVALLLALVVAASGGLRRTREAWRGAPFPESGRLAALAQVGPFMGWRAGVPAKRIAYWNARSQSTFGIAMVEPYKTDATAGDWNERGLQAASVGPEFFSTLGVRAAAGRLFNKDDAQGCRGCAVVSYGLWLRIAGRDVQTGGRNLRVIGALPRGFRFPGVDAALWTLADPQSDALAPAVCRLKAGVTAEAAEAELRDLIAHAGGTSGAWVTVTPLDAIVEGPIKTVIFVWLGVVGALALAALAGRRGGLRYRAFWAAKAGLSLTALLFAGIEFGGRLMGVEPGDTLLGAGAFSLWLALAGPGVALWWSWADQRTRCRTCLARLRMPAKLGYGARMLFETSGTELLCPKGHGRLLVSEGALSHREWAPLDATWRELFDAGAVSAGEGRR